MKKIIITLMLGIICTGIIAQKNSAFAMAKLKSKDAQFKGQLLYRLTFSEFNQLALGKRNYINVYSYVLAVDSVALNNLRDAIQNKIKALGSNVNQAQVTAAIEALANDKALQQLMKDAKISQVDVSGGMEDITNGSVMGSASGVSAGSMPASLYNQLFNLAAGINDPSGFAKDGDAPTTDAKGAPLDYGPDDKTTWATQDKNQNQIDKIGTSKDGKTTFYSQATNPSGMYAAHTDNGVTTWAYCSNCRKGTPTPDDGSVGNSAQYLQHILGSKLFSGMAKQFFTNLQIKLGAGVDAPGKGTTIDKELAFEAAMEGHFFQAWKTDLAARKTGNDGTPFDPKSSVSGAIEISFNSNIGAIDPSQISMKVNGNAVIVK